MNQLPRILFAAPQSGSGKTMITCGIIEVLKRQGKRVASFKCGPDYIDPMFHRQVLGVPAGNLDTYFTEDAVTRYLFWNKAKDADISILEGAMGYYDGMGGTSLQASTYELAKVTETPVILIVDAKGASVSLAAVIKGIVEYKEDSGIEAILLNRVSAGYYDRIKAVIEKECQIPVIGYLPELKNLEVPSRHLGLVAPEEMNAFSAWVTDIAEALEQTVELDKLLTVAEGASAYAEDVEQQVIYADVEDVPDYLLPKWLLHEGTQVPEQTEEEAVKVAGKSTTVRVPCLSEKVRIAVARDEAFSFYYAENLELLQRMGAELVFFSPLHDKELPKQIDGLLLGGGYPENFAKELEENVSMRESVRKACRKKIPCLAECGGFLYLQEKLEGSDGNTYKMTGALEGTGFRTQRLCRFGYVQVFNLSAGVIGESGHQLKGHEFHYWDSTENGGDCIAGKPGSSRTYSCMIHTNNLLAGFPHLYYYSNPQAVYHYLTRCQSFRAGRLAKEHWDNIAKPIDSLGLLEDYVVKISGIVENAAPYDISHRALVIFCADHGVVEEGVTQTGQEVTKIVSENFAKGASTVNIMAKSANVDVYVVDIGMNTEFYPEKELVMGAVIDRKIARGSRNLAIEEAMTLSECWHAIQTGMNMVKELKEKGYSILSIGEMGIGNTTPTSALAACFLKKDVIEVTGKGAGLSEEGLEKKRKVIAKALRRVEEKQLTDPWEILAEVGGFEIAAMAGVCLGGVLYQIPIVIDGAISTVAALAATRIDARVPDYLLASHISEEPVGKMALEAMGIEAILHGRMCLGEGTGAVALFPLLDMAMEVYKKMGSFEDYAIDAYERF